MERLWVLSMLRPTRMVLLPCPKSDRGTKAEINIELTNTSTLASSACYRRKSYVLTAQIIFGVCSLAFVWSGRMGVPENVPGVNGVGVPCFLPFALKQSLVTLSILCWTILRLLTFQSRLNDEWFTRPFDYGLTVAFQGSTVSTVVRYLLRASVTTWSPTLSVLSTVYPSSREARSHYLTVVPNFPRRA